MKCRHCDSEVSSPLIDLGTAPPSNAYLSLAQLQAPEKWFPLKVMVCEVCWLVQTQDVAQAAELFDADYAYFSSFSSSWLEHAALYAARMSKELLLGSDSHVVEIAANDGYLLQYFKEKGIPCTGIEPTSSTAAAARLKGLSMVEDFFGIRLAHELVRSGLTADLAIANNVLAHVPDINDFVAGFAIVLKETGVATFEFPHVVNLIRYDQFDTIYHEHFSYLSLFSVERIFAKNGLRIFDVEEHQTHGGSLRVFAQRSDTGIHARKPSVDLVLDRELALGIAKLDFYANLQGNAEAIKYEFLEFLLSAKREGHLIAGYGAAAKGNTLLNFVGVRADLLPFVVDRNPAKQHKYLPGSRIPIVDEEHLRQTKPRYVIIFPWNLRSEVMEQMAYIEAWGGRFVTIVPRLQIHETSLR